jgi:hypothetical protein
MRPTVDRFLATAQCISLLCTWRSAFGGFMGTAVETEQAVHQPNAFR